MNEIVVFAIKQRILVVVALLLVILGGIIGFLRLNIEAYPDPVPPLVDVITQSSGQSAEEIERYITIPSKCRWRAYRTSRRYAPSRYSDCPM